MKKQFSKKIGVEYAFQVGNYHSLHLAIKPYHYCQGYLTSRKRICKQVVLYSDY